MTCPNCGQAFEGSRCPNCGWPVASTGSRIASVFVVVFRVLPAGIFGACSVVGLAGFPFAGHDPLTFILFLLFAIAGLALAYGAMQWAKSLWNG
ncbi:hypothetical protein EON82_00915 [bacterium]|nr:MAG: hypothetical protein EON82_00915 [bacterium]